MPEAELNERQSVRRLNSLFQIALLMTLALTCVNAHAIAIAFDNFGVFSAPSSSGTGAFAEVVPGSGDPNEDPDDRVQIGKGFSAIEELDITGTFDTAAGGVLGSGPSFLIKESIFNNTNDRWTDFHVDFLFEPDAPGAETFWSISNFAITSTVGQSFVNSGGSTGIDLAGDFVGVGQELKFQFLVTLSGDGTAGDFVITERPTLDGVAPEPTTLALLGLGLAGLGAGRRKKA